MNKLKPLNSASEPQMKYKNKKIKEAYTEDLYIDRISLNIGISDYICGNCECKYTGYENFSRYQHKGD